MMKRDTSGNYIVTYNGRSRTHRNTRIAFFDVEQHKNMLQMISDQIQLAQHCTVQAIMYGMEYYGKLLYLLLYLNICSMPKGDHFDI